MNMNWTFYDAAGLVGVAMIIYAYLMLQLDKMEEDELQYSVLNGVGAMLILVSLIGAWNVSAFVMETIWVAISMIGVVKYFRARRAKR
jgi:hypothetical protein